MKKILLALGTLATIASPIAAVISCGTSKAHNDAVKPKVKDASSKDNTPEGSKEPTGTLEENKTKKIEEVNNHPDIPHDQKIDLANKLDQAKTQEELNKVQEELEGVILALSKTKTQEFVKKSEEVPDAEKQTLADKVKDAETQEQIDKIMEPYKAPMLKEAKEKAKAKLTTFGDLLSTDDKTQYVAKVEQAKTPTQAAQVAQVVENHLVAESQTKNAQEISELSNLKDDQIKDLKAELEKAYSLNGVKIVMAKAHLEEVRSKALKDILVYYSFDIAHATIIQDRIEKATSVDVINEEMKKLKAYVFQDVLKTSEDKVKLFNNLLPDEKHDLIAKIEKAKDVDEINSLILAAAVKTLPVSFQDEDGNEQDYLNKNGRFDPKQIVLPDHVANADIFVKKAISVTPFTTDATTADVMIVFEMGEATRYEVYPIHFKRSYAQHLVDDVIKDDIVSLNPNYHLDTFEESPSKQLFHFDNDLLNVKNVKFLPSSLPIPTDINDVKGKVKYELTVGIEGSTLTKKIQVEVNWDKSINENIMELLSDSFTTDKLSEQSVKDIENDPQNLKHFIPQLSWIPNLKFQSFKMGIPTASATIQLGTETKDISIKLSETPGSVVNAPSVPDTLKDIDVTSFAARFKPKNPVQVVPETITADDIAIPELPNGAYISNVVQVRNLDKDNYAIVYITLNQGSTVKTLEVKLDYAKSRNQEKLDNIKDGLIASNSLLQKTLDANSGRASSLRVTLTNGHTYSLSHSVANVDKMTPAEKLVIVKLMLGDSYTKVTHEYDSSAGSMAIPKAPKLTVYGKVIPGIEHDLEHLTSDEMVIFVDNVFSKIRYDGYMSDTTASASSWYYISTFNSPASLLSFMYGRYMHDGSSKSSSTDSASYSRSDMMLGSDMLKTALKYSTPTSIKDLSYSTKVRIYKQMLFGQYSSTKSFFKKIQDNTVFEKDGQSSNGKPMPNVLVVNDLITGVKARSSALTADQASDLYDAIVRSTTATQTTKTSLIKRYISKLGQVAITNIVQKNDLKGYFESVDYSGSLTDTQKFSSGAISSLLSYIQGHKLSIQQDKAELDKLSYTKVSPDNAVENAIQYVIQEFSQVKTQAAFETELTKFQKIFKIPAPDLDDLKLQVENLNPSKVLLAAEDTKLNLFGSWISLVGDKTTIDNIKELFTNTESSLLLTKLQYQENEITIDLDEATAKKVTIFIPKESITAPTSTQLLSTISKNDIITQTEGLKASSFVSKNSNQVTPEKIGIGDIKIIGLPGATITSVTEVKNLDSNDYAMVDVNVLYKGSNTILHLTLNYAKSRNQEKLDAIKESLTVHKVLTQEQLEQINKEQDTSDKDQAYVVLKDGAGTQPKNPISFVPYDLKNVSPSEKQEIVRILIKDGYLKVNQEYHPAIVGRNAAPARPAISGRGYVAARKNTFSPSLASSPYKDYAFMFKPISQWTDLDYIYLFNAYRNLVGGNYYANSNTGATASWNPSMDIGGTRRYFTGFVAADSNSNDDGSSSYTSSGGAKIGRQIISKHYASITASYRAGTPYREARSAVAAKAAIAPVAKKSLIINGISFPSITTTTTSTSFTSAQASIIYDRFVKSLQSNNPDGSDIDKTTIPEFSGVDVKSIVKKNDLNKYFETVDYDNTLTDTQKFSSGAISTLLSYVQSNKDNIKQDITELDKLDYTRVSKDNPIENAVQYIIREFSRVRTQVNFEEELAKFQRIFKISPADFTSLKSRVEALKPDKALFAAGISGFTLFGKTISLVGDQNTINNIKDLLVNTIGDLVSKSLEYQEELVTISLPGATSKEVTVFVLKDDSKDSDLSTEDNSFDGNSFDGIDNLITSADKAAIVKELIKDPSVPVTQEYLPTKPTVIPGEMKAFGTVIPNIHHDLEHLTDAEKIIFVNTVFTKIRSDEPPTGSDPYIKFTCKDGHEISQYIDPLYSGKVTATMFGKTINPLTLDQYKHWPNMDDKWVPISSVSNSYKVGIFNTLLFASPHITKFTPALSQGYISHSKAIWDYINQHVTFTKEIKNSLVIDGIQTDLHEESSKITDAHAAALYDKFIKTDLYEKIRALAIPRVDAALMARFSSITLTDAAKASFCPGEDGLTKDMIKFADNNFNVVDLKFVNYDISSPTQIVKMILSYGDATKEVEFKVTFAKSESMHILENEFNDVDISGIKAGNPPVEANLKEGVKIPAVLLAKYPNVVINKVTYKTEPTIDQKDVTLVVEFAWGNNKYSVEVDKTFDKSGAEALLEQYSDFSSTQVIESNVNPKDFKISPANVLKYKVPTAITDKALITKDEVEKDLDVIMREKKIDVEENDVDDIKNLLISKLIEELLTKQVSFADSTTVELYKSNTIQFEALRQLMIILKPVGFTQEFDDAINDFAKLFNKDSTLDTIIQDLKHVVTDGTKPMSETNMNLDGKSIDVTVSKKYTVINMFGLEDWTLFGQDVSWLALTKDQLKQFFGIIKSDYDVVEDSNIQLHNVQLESSSTILAIRVVVRFTKSEDKFETDKLLGTIDEDTYDSLITIDQSLTDALPQNPLDLGAFKLDDSFPDDLKVVKAVYKANPTVGATTNGIVTLTLQQGDVTFTFDVNVNFKSK